MTGPRSHGRLEAELDPKSNPQSRKIGKGRVFMFAVDELKAARLVLLLKQPRRKLYRFAVHSLRLSRRLSLNRNKNMSPSVLGNKQLPGVSTEQGSWTGNGW